MLKYSLQFAAVGIVLLGSCVLGLSQTDAGRAFTAERIERAVSAGIAGAMTVGELRSVSWDQVVARDLVFQAPSGEEVLRLDEVRLVPGYLKVLQGKITIDRAEARGGRLVIHELPDGTVPLEEAFKSPNPGSGGPSPEIALHDIVAEDLTLVLSLDSLETMKVTSLDALVRIDLSAAGDLDVRFAQAKGTLHNHPLGDRATLSDVDGRVRGKATHVLDMQAGVHTEGERFTLHIDYYNREERPVVITANGVDASWVGVRMKAMAAASELLSAVDLSINDG